MVTGLLLVVCLVLSRLNLHLDTDWLVLFRADRPEIQSLRYWRETLPGSKDMAVIISGGTLAERQIAAGKLGQRFQEKSMLLEEPLESLETDLFIKSGLYFLTAEQLRVLEKDSALALLGTANLNLQEEAELDYVTENMALTYSGSELMARGLEAFVQTLESATSEKKHGGLFPDLVPESKELGRYLGSFPQVPPQAYLSLDGGQTLLVLVRPRLGNRSLEEAAPAVTEVRAIVRELRKEFRSLNLSLTGEPVLVVDERRTIAMDSVRGTICSLFLVVVLFQFGFREFSRPFLALSSLCIGLIWTLGVVSVGIGHLNFITITYVPILVGIGLDFGIHMAFRYYEQRQSEEPEQAMEHALNGAGRDTFFGAVTTSASFAVLAIIGFRGVSELGLIALVGVLLCQISACTFLPACLAWFESRGHRLPTTARQELSQTEEQLSPLDQPILMATGLLIVFSALFAPRVGFNVHLLKMQNPQLESVKTELQLVAEGKSSVLTALIAAPDLETARRLEGELRALPTVAEVISLATFLPASAEEKRESVVPILERRVKLLRLLSFLKTLPAATAQDALHLMERFRTLNLLPERNHEVQDELALLEAQLKRRGPGPVMDAFEELRTDTLERLEGFGPLLERQGAQPLTVHKLPQKLRSRLLRQDGAFVLKVFPQVDIWRPENLHRFLKDVRSVTPEVSGEPVLIELFEKLVLRTHWRGIALSLIAMLCVLILILRRPQDILLAGLPTVVSLILVTGFMGFFGWNFNPANFVAVPMLLGLGSVFGLHSVLRMRELGHERLLSCSTGPAIILSAATSMAGFASLGLADHRGIASLGWLVTVGLLVNAFLSILVLPAWLRFRRKSS